MLERRKVFDQEFKENAVKLSEEEGRTAKEVAKNLGISSHTLYGWRREFRDQGILEPSGNVKEKSSLSEKDYRALKRELEDVKLERDILKKAVGIFSRTPK